jgi:hypothetical protein
VAGHQPCGVQTAHFCCVAGATCGRGEIPALSISVVGLNCGTSIALEMARRLCPRRAYQPTRGSPARFPHAGGPFSGFGLFRFKIFPATDFLPALRGSVFEGSCNRFCYRTPDQKIRERLAARFRDPPIRHRTPLCPSAPPRRPRLEAGARPRPPRQGHEATERGEAGRTGAG